MQSKPASLQHKRMDIRADSIRLGCKEDENDTMDFVPWLGFFLTRLTFPSVVRLRTCGELGPYVAPALEGIVADMETIRKVFLELSILIFQHSRKSIYCRPPLSAFHSHRPGIVRYAVFPCISNDKTREGYW